MTSCVTHFQFLQPAAAARIAAQTVGKLTPVATHDAEPAPFTILDCFDQSLRRSGRLLLEAGKHFELLDDKAPAVSQPATGSPRFISEFPPGPVQRALADLSPLRRLLAVGSGQRRQTTLAFVDDDGKTHCRVGLMHLETDEGHAAILVALQGIKGYGKSLNALRAHLEQLGAAPTSCSAPSVQLFPARPAYDARPDILIGADETAFDAANKIIAACLSIARENEAGIIADHDTEFLHDYRVQLRKIRSVLSLFKGVYDETLTAELKAAFSALAQPTGRLRDLDVHLLERNEYHALLPESLHPGLDALFDVFARQRAAEQKRLARHLRGGDYQRDIGAAVSRFSKPRAIKRGLNAGLAAHDYACERIWLHYRRVRKAAAAIGPDTPDAEVHELRIRCKKLRYLMEFFAPVFPRPSLNAVLKPLKRLQEHLGLFNDYSVQQESLRDFLLEPGKKADAASLEIAQSVGALIAVLHGRQLEQRERIMAGLARFNRPRVQQTFSELFQRKDDT